MDKGVLSGIGAYVLWGLFPVYWKLLHNVQAVQIIGHRIIWSFIFLIGIIFFKGQLNKFRRSVTSFKIFSYYILASILVTSNWFLFVLGVTTGRIVETSLGYFINPLFSVLLGVVFLRERLRILQWVPVGIAAAGVLFLTVEYGNVPWIALSLAFTFGLYGLVKKISPLDSLFGLTFETALVFPFALGYIIFQGAAGTGFFMNSDMITTLLLIGTGAVTSIPLLMFASAARSIPLSTVGILQYIAPTLQFLIGVLVYHEKFDGSDFIGFSFVWAALIIFGTEGYRAGRIQKNRIEILS